jgi:hypothetical protein
VLAQGIIIVALYGRLQVAKSMYMPLGMLLVVHLLAPTSLFSARLVDTRLPVAILFVALSGTQLFLWSKACRRVLLSSLVILLVVRSIVFAYDWHRYDQVIQAFVSTFAQLPSHSILFVAREGPESAMNLSSFRSFKRLDRRFWQPPLNHVASLATLQQSIFVPTTHANPAQQPIVVTSRYASMYNFQRRDPIRVKNAEELAHVTDQIRRLVVDTGLPPVPVFLLLLYPEFLQLPLPHGTAAVGAGPHFLILAVNRI